MATSTLARSWRTRYLCRYLLPMIIFSLLGLVLPSAVAVEAAGAANGVQCPWPAPTLYVQVPPHTRRPTFYWSAVPGAPYYTLHVVSTYPDDSLWYPFYGLTGTSFTPNMDWPDGWYRAKIRADGPPCGAGPYSNQVFFRIGY